MDLLRQFVDYFLNLDVHLGELLRTYGTWTYAILFLIIFTETGLVVMPLLPGDSLLFIVGAMCGAACGTTKKPRNEPGLLYFWVRPTG